MCVICEEGVQPSDARHAHQQRGPPRLELLTATMSWIRRTLCPALNVDDFRCRKWHIPSVQVTTNTSGGGAEVSVWTDPDGRDHCVVVLKRMFVVGPQGEISGAEPPCPFVPADIHYGDPATSSVRYESDFAPYKPAAEVLVLGEIMAPGGRPATEVLAGVRVGGLVKRILAIGDRYWTQGFGRIVPSAPKPFERIPLLYENAFGGAELDSDGRLYEFSRQNPVGRGLYRRDAASLGQRLPNLEYPDCRLTDKSDRPAPACLGAVGRSWLPRLSFAGTYDARWLDTQYPFLPRDFSLHYFQSAPKDQQLPELRAGDECVCVHLCEQGHFFFRLPEWITPIRFRFSDRDVETKAAPDTLIIEPTQRRFTMIARAQTVIGRKITNLKEILVGKHVLAPSPDDEDKPYFRSLAEFIAWKNGDNDDSDGDSDGDNNADEEPL